MKTLEKRLDDLERVINPEPKKTPSEVLFLTDDQYYRSLSGGKYLLLSRDEVNALTDQTEQIVFFTDFPISPEAIVNGDS